MGNSFPLWVIFDMNDDSSPNNKTQDTKVQETYHTKSSSLLYTEASLIRITPSQRSFTSTKQSTNKGEHAFD